MMKYIKKMFLLLVFFVWVPNLVFAHTMWLEKTGYGYDLSYGEKGHTDLYEPSRVTSIDGYTDNKEKKSLSFSKHILKDNKGLARIFLDNQYLMLTADLDNKYWVHTDKGWENTRIPKNADKILEEGKSYKSTKHIIKWKNYMTKPMGLNIEIVPLKDPTKLKEGDILEIQCYKNGKTIPSQDVKIAKNSNPHIHHALEYGIENKPLLVAISKKGLQVISAKYKVQISEKEVIWYAFTLSFDTSVTD